MAARTPPGHNRPHPAPLARLEALAPIRLRPTFPLDGVRIRQMKRQALWRLPRLWLPWLTAQFASLFDTGETPAHSGFGRLTHAAIQYWQDLDSELTADVVRKLIADSNCDQDRQLVQQIGQLRTRGSRQYAISMGKFLLLKQHVERQLHGDGEFNERKQSIESLVDSLCSEVCQKLFRLAQLEEQLADILTSRDPNQLTRLQELRGAGHRSVLDAYASLYDTAQHLNILVKPGREAPHRKEDDLAALDRLIAVLRDEHDLARKVHDRIRRELPQEEDRPGADRAQQE